MPVFQPESLARWAGGRWSGPPARPIRGFSADTRQMKPGDLFVALATERRDGHEFLEEALAGGASAALVSAPRPVALAQLAVNDTLAAFHRIARAHRRQFPGPVVGVSGSAGKTSTKDLLALLLGNGPDGQGPAAATEANMNNHIGVPLTLVRLDPSVHRFAVVEAGVSARGEMAPLAAMIEPDIAILTLVAPAHLAGLGGLEEVAREKAALAAAVRENGLAIFPESCAAFKAFRELGGKALVVSDGPGDAGSGDRVRLAFSHGGDTTELALSGPGQPAGAFSLCRVTDGMARNAALAVLAALHLGIPAEAVRERLRNWRPAKWRGEIVRRADCIFYLDFYNANPASMTDAVKAFDGLAPPEWPRVYLVGCMEELGPGSARYHRELGRSIRLRSGDVLVVVGEQAGEVRAGALERGAPSGNVLAPGAVDPALMRRLTRDGPCALFVKGSRRYELERALADIAPLEVAHA